MGARGWPTLGGDGGVPFPDTPGWMQRSYLGCLAFSETGARIHGYSRGDDVAASDGLAAFDGSTNEQARFPGVGISASWRGEDNIIWTSSSWLPLPWVRGSAACAILCLDNVNI